LEGKTTGISFNGSTLINGSTVSIPLQTDLDATTFRFILNFGNGNPAVVNEDIIKLNYSEPMNLYQELVVSKLRIP
jgi:hypothetical protein